MTRRDLLVAGAGTAVLATGCGPVVRRLHAMAPAAPPDPKTEEIRLLDRLHYGPSGPDLARIRDMGTAAWIDDQLKGEAEDPPGLVFALHRLDVLAFEPDDLRGRPEDEVLRQLQSAAVLRATYSPNGLRARLEEHWADRFNVYARKGLATYRLARYRDTLGDPLGSHPEMIRRLAKSPAMLAYLDGPQNVKEKPNENLARELLELHTLGVNGGYSQRDVMEVARCLTGWRLENRFLRRRGNALFDAKRHDDGPKTVLGRTIPAGGGEKDLVAVLDILTEHPSTARYCAEGLVRRLLGRDDERWTARLVKAYVASKGSIRETLRPLATSQELLDAAPREKRPFETVVSALRAVNARTDAGPALLGHLAAMGHSPYEWPMPDGYPMEPEAWRGGSLPRWRFGLDLARNRIEGTEVPDDPPVGLSPKRPGPDGLALALLDPRFAQC